METQTDKITSSGPFNLMLSGFTITVTLLVSFIFWNIVRLLRYSAGEESLTFHVKTVDVVAAPEMTASASTPSTNVNDTNALTNGTSTKKHRNKKKATRKAARGKHNNKQATNNGRAADVNPPAVQDKCKDDSEDDRAYGEWITKTRKRKNGNGLRTVVLNSVDKSNQCFTKTKAFKELQKNTEIALPPQQPPLNSVNESNQCEQHRQQQENSVTVRPKHCHDSTKTKALKELQNNTDNVLFKQVQEHDQEIKNLKVTHNQTMLKLIAVEEKLLDVQCQFRRLLDENDKLKEKYLNLFLKHESYVEGLQEVQDTTIRNLIANQSKSKRMQTEDKDGLAAAAIIDNRNN